MSIDPNQKNSRRYISGRMKINQEGILVIEEEKASKGYGSHVALSQLGWVSPRKLRIAEHQKVY